MVSRSLGVAAVLAAIALGAMTPVSAQAVDGNAIIEIKNVARGLCVTDGGDSIVLAPCDGGSDQAWEKAPVKQGGYVLRNAHSGKCAIGWSSLASWYCDVEDVEETVKFVPPGVGVVGLARLQYGRGYATALPELTSFIDVAAESSSDFGLWEVTAVGRRTHEEAKGVIRIKSHYRQMCAAPVTRSDIWHTIALADCAEVPEQRFERIELGDSWFQLRSATRGVCLSEATYTVDLEAACDANDVKQRWRLDTDSLGLAFVRSSIGKVLGPSPSPNTHIGLYAEPTDFAYADKWEVTAA